ncbi:MAG: DUF1275 domain-containing protein [Firmicutes bacterium]|nr:DUF1275 domain-containing protein [Bacillota bacterium]
MLVADENCRRNTHRVAALTLASLFVMGYINALVLHTYDMSTIVSAQTGNVVWMGINLAWGDWIALLENLGLLFGFMFGAIFALYTYKMFTNKKLQFFYNWTVFILPILLYPLVLQSYAPPVVSFLLLGFATGATLGFFRKIYHMEINTSMATANVRFLGLHFAKGFLKKDTRGKQGRATFWVFFTAVFTFAFGAFAYVMFARLDSAIGFEYMTMIALAVFCLVPYFLCPVKTKPAMVVIEECCVTKYQPEEGEQCPEEEIVTNLKKLITMTEGAQDTTLNASPEELQQFRELLAKMVDLV